MKIIKAWYDRADAYPILRIQVEGFEPLAVIDTECFKHLRGRKWKAVFIGVPFYDLVPEITREGQQFRGFTADPEIVALAEEFMRSTEDGSFKPGKYVVGEPGK